LENIWDEWSKIDAKKSTLLSTKTSKVSKVNNQQEDNRLHIERVLQDLVDGMLMESRDAMSYVLCCDIS